MTLSRQSSCDGFDVWRWCRKEMQGSTRAPTKAVTMTVRWCFECLFLAFWKIEEDREDPGGDLKNINATLNHPKKESNRSQV